jgi:hypothetical protein
MGTIDHIVPLGPTLDQQPNKKEERVRRMQEFIRKERAFFERKKKEGWTDTLNFTARAWHAYMLLCTRCQRMLKACMAMLTQLGVRHPQHGDSLPPQTTQQTPAACRPYVHSNSNPTPLHTTPADSKHSHSFVGACGEFMTPASL